MKKKSLSYTLLVLIHVIIGLVIFVVPLLSKIYALLIPIVGLSIVIRNQNRNNEVIFVAAYLVGVEVF